MGSPEVEKEGSTKRALDFSGKDDCTMRLLAFGEHVQKMQQQWSLMSNVDLLWDQRKKPDFNEDTCRCFCLSPSSPLCIYACWSDYCMLGFSILSSSVKLGFNSVTTFSLERIRFAGYKMMMNPTSQTSN